MVQPSGNLLVSAGQDTWDLALAALSYGGAAQPLETVRTLTSGDRVDCNYGAIDEWLVNGADGMEQGFNVTPPPSAAGELLTVALAMRGDLTATVNAAGNGLTLTRADGSSVLAYTGLMAYDAAGKTLPASMEVYAADGRQELLIRVDTAGAEGQITIDPSVQQETAPLSSFDNAHGAAPPGSLTLSDSTLYGMTAVGGANGEGTIFSVPAGGGTPTILFSFDNTHGEFPQGSLTVDSSGSTLYGMTAGGGANGEGTIFSMPTGGGTPTVLFSFDNTHGEFPMGICC